MQAVEQPHSEMQSDKELLAEIVVSEPLSIIVPIYNENATYT